MCQGSVLQDLLLGPDPPASKHLAHMTPERWTNLITLHIYSACSEQSESISENLCAEGLQTDLIPENPEDLTQQEVQSRLSPNQTATSLQSVQKFDFGLITKSDTANYCPHHGTLSRY